MTAPIGTHVRESLESMRYSVIQFLLVRICLSVGFANTFSNHFVEASLVAGVFAVLALHASRIFEEVSTQCATHDAIELLNNEFVSILLLDFFFPLS